MNPEKFWYTEDHEWVGEIGGSYAVGITDHAQDALGDITYVELPAVDRVVAAHEETAVVESVKAASDVFAPVGGRVSEVNGELEAHPEFINQDPYGKGWFFKLDGVDAGELEGLMNAEAYRAFVASQAH